MAAYNQINPNEPGLHYNFRTSLPHGEYFAITPTFQPPHNSRPIVDEQTGMCIGYSVAQAPGLWQIYDTDGRLATLEEAPLETPIIDPTDIALFMFGAFRLLRTGRVMFEAASGGRVAAALSAATLNILGAPQSWAFSCQPKIHPYDCRTHGRSGPLYSCLPSRKSSPIWKARARSSKKNWTI